MKTLNNLLIMLLLMTGLLTSGFVSAQTPDEMLESVTDKALAELKKDDGEMRNDISKLYDMVDRLILPVVDVKAMSKLILGKHWKRANAEQRANFMDSFTKLIKFTYTKSLKEYANQTIEYFPKKTKIREKYASVYSEFVPGGGATNIPVVYKLRQSSDGNWKAYDLVIENLSLVKNYRTDFDREISATSLDSLLVRLKKEQDEQKKLAQGE